MQYLGGPYAGGYIAESLLREQGVGEYCLLCEVDHNALYLYRKRCGTLRFFCGLEFDDSGFDFINTVVIPEIERLNLKQRASRKPIRDYWDFINHVRGHPDA